MLRNPIVKIIVSCLVIFILLLVVFYICSDAKLPLLLSSFATLLTAMAAFVFGLYQVLKDECTVAFVFSVLSNNADGQSSSEKKTILRIINAGEKPIYLDVLPDPQNHVIIQAVSEKKDTIILRFFNSLNSRWFADALQTSGLSFIDLQADGELANDPSSGNRIFVLKAGKDIRFFMPNTGVFPEKEDWLDFVKNGKYFYIEDVGNKRYYIPNKQVQKVKKALEI